jgi:hypothetical protein
MPDPARPDLRLVPKDQPAAKTIERRAMFGPPEESGFTCNHDRNILWSGVLKNPVTHLVYSMWAYAWRLADFKPGSSPINATLFDVYKRGELPCRVTGEGDLAKLNSVSVRQVRRLLLKAVREGWIRRVEIAPDGKTDIYSVGVWRVSPSSGKEVETLYVEGYLSRELRKKGPAPR